MPRGRILLPLRSPPAPARATSSSLLPQGRKIFLFHVRSFASVERIVIEDVIGGILHPVKNLARPGAVLSAGFVPPFDRVRHVGHIGIRQRVPIAIRRLKLDLFGYWISYDLTCLPHTRLHFQSGF